MNNVIRMSFVFLIINLTSCDITKVSDFDMDTAEDAFIINSSTNFEGYYYKGSDKEFHYFISRWDFLKDRYFKLKKDKLKVNQQFKFGKKELKIDFFDNESTKEFGHNEFYKLFVIE